MNAVQNLSFGNLLIRVVDRDGDPWFVASDVCAAMDIQNPTVAVKILDETDKSKLNLGLRGSDAIIISEPGLYTLMLRSREALNPDSPIYAFRKWVTGEVLPSLRKKGNYALHNGSEAEEFDRDLDDMRIKISAVREARLTHGRNAGRQMWQLLGLPELNDIAPIGVVAKLHGSIADWMAQRTEAVPGHRERVQVLYDDYVGWAQGAGLDRTAIVSATAFGRSLSSCGVAVVQSFHRYRVGLRLRGDGERLGGAD